MTNSNAIIEILSEQLSGIADEIENLSSYECGQLTSQDIIRLQKIDFCSQRLQDLANLAAQISKEPEANKIVLSDDSRSVLKLEHSIELFKSIA